MSISVIRAYSPARRTAWHVFACVIAAFVYVVIFSVNSLAMAPFVWGLSIILWSRRCQHVVWTIGTGAATASAIYLVMMPIILFTGPESLPFAVDVLVRLLSTSTRITVIGAVAGLLVLWVVSNFLSVVVQTGTLCWTCGYDLTGNVSGVCPECGTGIEPPTPNP